MLNLNLFVHLAIFLSVVAILSLFQIKEATAADRAVCTQVPIMGVNTIRLVDSPTPLIYNVRIEYQDGTTVLAQERNSTRLVEVTEADIQSPADRDIYIMRSYGYDISLVFNTSLEKVFVVDKDKCSESYSTINCLSTL